MDVDSTPKAGASTMVPVAIGLLGVALGAAALFMAFSSSSTSSKSANELTKAVSDATAKAEAAEKKAADLESAVLRLNETNQKLDAAVARVVSNVNSEFIKVGAAITEDRGQMQKLADSVQQLAAKPAPPANPAAGNTTASTEPALKPGIASVHAIVSNDSFSTLARKFGVTIEAIQAANPGVNPNRLQIGQKINIPAPPPASGPPSTPPGN